MCGWRWGSNEFSTGLSLSATDSVIIDQMRRIALMAVVVAAFASGSSTLPRSGDLERPHSSAATLSCKFVRGPKDEADPQPFVFRISRTGDLSKPLAIWITTG